MVTSAAARRRRPRAGGPTAGQLIADGEEVSGARESWGSWPFNPGMRAPGCVERVPTLRAVIGFRPPNGSVGGGGERSVGFARTLAVAP
jgi:hypothetical protein